MVKMKPEFVATKYPGYFFNTSDEQLYSMKIDGVLKPLKFHEPNRFNHMYNFTVKLRSGERVRCTGGFYVSVKGFRKLYPIEALRDLEDTDHTIPVREVE